jgi:2-polyprenyl-3-methyl-5-hydroxy-6-metoxy-1,4-benzoquinol methylase
MVTVKQRLGSQARVPSGIAGWVTSALMLLAGPSGCFHEPVAERLGLQPDDVVLDVACGSGLFLRRRASHVHRVAGIDLSGIQIRLARWILRQRLRAGTA